MAYREWKEAGKVPRSIAVRHAGMARGRAHLIKEGIHHSIDHLPRIRRHGFGQSFRMRPLRPSSPRRKCSADNTQTRALKTSTFAPHAGQCFRTVFVFARRAGRLLGLQVQPRRLSPCSLRKLPSNRQYPCRPRQSKKSPRFSNAQNADPRLSPQASGAIRLSGVSWAPAAP